MMSFLSPIVPRVLLLPRSAKQTLVLTMDVLLCVLTVGLAFYLRTDTLPPVGQRSGPVLAVLLSVS